MFTDRKDAGLKLARALGKYKDQNAIVLGIPRGGVEIAYYVALHLNADFSVIITRKLGHPENPEAAFGAIAEDGSIYLLEGNSGTVMEEEMDYIIEHEKKEIQRRIRVLRKNKPLPDLENKVVIIADDGIATGATLFSAIAMCRKKHPSKLVVAAPVASQGMEESLRTIADDVIILEKPPFLNAVGQGYRHFENLSDEETIAFIDAWENRSRKASVTVL